ncbi:glycosyltransferase [Argonema antarcticum]|uniref:glycosyltransferase n=1 Tax=Argonema antarcticum TaxID=2942763 RepID=UPI0020132B84|nr:glycosyltransferase [Argonema antarcticum]MCL1475052.1 glycosyltransferase [Argonema antarcticum A004/B2]
MMFILEGFLLLLIGISVVFYAWCYFCTIRFFSTTKQEIYAGDCPVSILIPVCGVDEGAMENWTSLCNQDYENYEVLFGVMNPEDPAVPLLQEVVAKFPDRAKLFCGLEALGISHKISNLIHLLDAAQHEIVILVDSDIRVNPDYLRTVTAPLADPAIGVITCGFCDRDPKSLGAALASLGRCTEFIPSVLVARSIDGGLKFSLGPTIATRKSVLDKFGGLQKVVNRIGSDYHIGNMATEVGYRVELSKYILDNDCGRETVKEVFLRELRWARTIRLNRGLQYYGLGLSYGTVYCIPLLLLSGFQSWAVIVSLATITLRLIQAQAAIYSMNRPKLFWWLWALPIRDLMNFAIWVGGAFGQSVYWRGRRLRVQSGGILTELNVS